MISDLAFKADCPAERQCFLEGNSAATRRIHSRNVVKNVVLRFYMNAGFQKSSVQHEHASSATCCCHVMVCVSTCQN